LLVLSQAADAPSWLDRPLLNWNQAGASLPRPPATGDAKDAVVRRCKLQPPLTTAAERALDAAGWIPFWNVDQQLVRDDIEILGGMTAVDAKCQPANYNLFVFVADRFAGTLAPSSMTAERDGASGAVRVQPPLISADFARYGNADTPCCPSSRVYVRYRIERTERGPLIVPVELRTTRPEAQRR
jgi:hypothetical protein